MCLGVGRASASWLRVAPTNGGGPTRPEFQTAAAVKLVLRNGRYANEFDNRGLFDGVEINRGLTTPAQQNMLLNPGPADAGALMELIERAVADSWIERGEMR